MMRPPPKLVVTRTRRPGWEATCISLPDALKREIRRITAGSQAQVIAELIATSQKVRRKPWASVAILADYAGPRQPIHLPSHQMQLLRAEARATLRETVLAHIERGLQIVNSYDRQHVAT